MRRLPYAFVLVLAAPISAQQFVRNTAAAPASAGSTEQVDLADVDLDGDWDAAFANGGDSGNQQSRIWINQGNLQAGVLGEFADETAARFPDMPRASRDIEFVDYDSDGDPDIYLGNDSQLSAQSSLFWTNRGGLQGLTLGYYADESWMRWLDLGQAGSSIPPQLVLAGGGYLDYANDGDFADIDLDGDLDLVQATGGAFGNGHVPTRIFRNYGGFFRELNPGGFQLSGTDIANGDPGLWCEGIHSHDTIDATGQFCDVATSALNADWGDIDGDFDLDLLLGARDEMPRLFRNFASDTGAVAFRDVTGSAFPPSHATGLGHNEECLGDFDFDDDLDLYGVNWQQAGPDFDDQFLSGDGSGAFAGGVLAPGSSGDDDGAEPIDYDNDGDLDVFVANFSGQERVVSNDGGWTFSVPSGVLPSDSTATLDTDPADVDGDGDTDVICANDQDQSEWYLENMTDVDDTTPPSVARLERLLDREPNWWGALVRAHVYDNTSLQTSQFLEGQILYSVATGVYLTTPLRSSYGQVFRGEIDGTLTGLVAYRAIVADEHGNVGISGWKHYASGLRGTPFCSGDGSATACPCGNSTSPGRGCGNSLGTGARLVGTGTPSVSADSFELAVEGLTNSSCLFFQGDAQVADGAGAPFGDGLRCAGGAVWRIGTKIASENVVRYPEAGDTSVSVRGHLPAAGGTRHYQAWYRNTADYCTSSAFNLTNGWTVIWDV